MTLMIAHAGGIGRTQDNGDITISAVIKARNEARQIQDCIEAARLLASEIIVVDDNSEDCTAQIAAEHGATVIHAKSRDGLIDELDFIGFQHARGEWILRIDADERMVPALAGELRRVAASGSYAGARFARKNIMFGAWARHGGWFTSQHLRFFRKAAWNGKRLPGVHAQVAVCGPVAAIPAKEELATVHYDYDDVQSFVKRTLWKYAIPDAAARYAAGERFSSFLLLWSPVRRFLIRYLYRQGFRDGQRGLILAALLGGYEFCIIANLWDIDRQAKEEANCPGGCEGCP